MNKYNNIKSIVNAMYTPLDIRQETDFQLLKNMQRPYDSGYDYDLRGFYSQYGNLQPQATNGHLTDEYKLPIHPTFSTESNMYNGQEYAVDWNNPVWQAYDSPEGYFYGGLQ